MTAPWGSIVNEMEPEWMKFVREHPESPMPPELWWGMLHDKRYDVEWRDATIARLSAIVARVRDDALVVSVSRFAERYRGGAISEAEAEKAIDRYRSVVLAEPEKKPEPEERQTRHTIQRCEYGFSCGRHWISIGGKTIAQTPGSDFCMMDDDVVRLAVAMFQNCDWRASEPEKPAPGYPNGTYCIPADCSLGDDIRLDAKPEEAKP